MCIHIFLFLSLLYIHIFYFYHYHMCLCLLKRTTLHDIQFIFIIYIYRSCTCLAFNQVADSFELGILNIIFNNFNETIHLLLSKCTLLSAERKHKKITSFSFTFFLFSNNTLFSLVDSAALTSEAGGGSSYFKWFMFSLQVMESDSDKTKGVLPVDCTLTIKLVLG